MEHQLTAISASNPSGQASNRHVKATSPNFAIDSETLTGTGLLGMTGIELYKGFYNGALIYGDYSLPDIPHPQKISIQNQLIENYVAI